MAEASQVKNYNTILGAQPDKAEQQKEQNNVANYETIANAGENSEEPQGMVANYEQLAANVQDEDSDAQVVYNGVQPEVTAQDLLYDQELAHTVQVCYKIDNEDLANLILNYNNTVNSVTEQLPENCLLPIEVQSYQEFVDAITVPNPIMHSQLFQVTCQYIENTAKYTSQLQKVLEEQARYNNPYCDAIEQLLEFEKLCLDRIKQCKRVYQALDIISETRNARMQIELRLVNIVQLKNQITQIQTDECGSSEVREQKYRYENQKRISNRQQPIDKLYQLERREKEFRDIIMGRDQQPQIEITDIYWLYEQIQMHHEAIA